MELTIEDVQITLRRDDEHAIGLDVQAFCNEFDWHMRVIREDFMEEGGRRSQVINDNDRYAKIGGQISKQAFVSIESAG